MSDESSAAIVATRKDFISEHLDSYLQSGGVEGHIVDITPVGGHPFTTHCLIKYTGRKSGKTFITPLIYGDIGGEVVICASKGGADSHPDWYLNIVAQDVVEFQIGTQAFQATWREPEGAEREKLWAFMVDIFPSYAGYQTSTERQIPLLIMKATKPIPVFKESDATGTRQFSRKDEPMFETQDASPRVGTIVRTTKADMLKGTYADEINRLLTKRSALVFPDMHFTDEEQLEFAGTIGEVFLVGGKNIQKISMDPAVNPVADYTRGAFFWHIDGANDAVPAKATMLTARMLAGAGEGDTMVANTYAAYEDLPDEDKELIGRLRARHCLESTQRLVNPDPSYAELQRWQAYPSKSHPLVWQHLSGEKSMLIGATAYYIEDMSIEEGKALLCRLQEFATQPQYVFRHKWSVGDFLLWDNTGTMHKAASYPLDSKRLMHRTTLCGEEAITG